MNSREQLKGEMERLASEGTSQGIRDAAQYWLYRVEKVAKPEKGVFNDVFGDVFGNAFGASGGNRFYK